MSKQKEAIYTIVASTMSHPTADWIYQKARARMPHISLGTVYRNLNTLCEQGRLLEITTRKGPSRYDANISQHSHLRCLHCDRLEDLPKESFKAQYPKRKIRGYNIVDYRLEMLGVCPDCQQSKSALKQ